MRTFRSLSTSVGRSLRSMTFHRGHSGKAKIGSDLGVREDDEMIPAQPPLGPAVVVLDEFVQGITGFAGLADRVDFMLVTAPLLPPGMAVVPDIAALDLEAGDAGTFYRNDEIHLVILEVIGHTLAGDDTVVGLKLFEQSLVNLPLGAVGKARSLIRRDRHAAGPTMVEGRTGGRGICAIASRASAENETRLKPARSARRD
jgi:hypothetical protein